MSKKGLTEHHVTPRARGGTAKDVTLWPDNFHTAFHMVFGDLTPNECEEMLRRVSVPGTFWTGVRLRDLRKQIKEEKAKGG